MPCPHIFHHDRQRSPPHLRQTVHGGRSAGDHTGSAPGRSDLPEYIFFRPVGYPPMYRLPRCRPPSLRQPCLRMSPSHLRKEIAEASRSGSPSVRYHPHRPAVPLRAASRPFSVPVDLHISWLLRLLSAFFLFPCKERLDPAELSLIA